MNARVNRLVGFVLTVSLVGVVGCGTGINEALYQTASASGRTAADLLLTELINAIADAVYNNANPADDADDGDDGSDADDGDADDGDDGDDVPADDLTPDAAAGQALYDAGCAACHCADGSGGCAASAPAATGLDFDALDALLGEAAHFGQGPLDNQELTDLDAHLASL